MQKMVKFVYMVNKNNMSEKGRFEMGARKLDIPSRRKKKEIF